MPAHPDTSALIPLAAILEHDANNLIGKLYAAADWLGEKPDEEALFEGRLAIAQSLSAVLGLQAVFHLMALADQTDASERLQGFSKPVQARLFARLKEAAGVDAPSPDERFASTGLPAGADSLSAALVCAARLMRRRVGNKPALNLSLHALPSGDLQLRLTAGLSPPLDPRESQRPEALVLASARARLGTMGLSWCEPATAEDAWQFTLAARGGGA